MTSPNPGPRVAIENLRPHTEPGAPLLGRFDVVIGRGTVRLRNLELVVIREEQPRVMLPAAVEVLDAGLREAITVAAREAWRVAGEPIA